MAMSAAALAVTGCGGEEQLSQAELRAQGNAICAKYEKQIDEVAVPSSVDEIPAYVGKAGPIVEREIDELKALNPSEESRETYDQMIAEAEKTLAAGRSLGDAAEKGDDVAVEKALDEGNRASDKADEHARALGLTECIDEGE